MKGKDSRKLFTEGCNCAQSVVCAYSDELNISEEVLNAIACPFGAGVARCRNVCGAVSGMMMVLGVRHKDKDKAELYQICRQYIDKFVAEFGSMICSDLLEGITTDNSPLPEARTKQYYAVRPCADIVEFAANLIEEK